MTIPKLRVGLSTLTTLKLRLSRTYDQILVLIGAVWYNLEGNRAVRANTRL